MMKFVLNNRFIIGDSGSSCSFSYVELTLLMFGSEIELRNPISSAAILTSRTSEVLVNVTRVLRFFGSLAGIDTYLFGIILVLIG